MASEQLLEVSPYQSDSGELIGRTPSEVPSEILSLNFRAPNPLKALREKCLDCCVGNVAEVRKCVSTDCALWPFRSGSNPFRKRSVLSEDEKRRRAAQLRRRVSGEQCVNR
jgi:hypothetical protein